MLASSTVQYSVGAMFTELQWSVLRVILHGYVTNLLCPRRSRSSRSTGKRSTLEQYRYPQCYVMFGIYYTTLRLQETTQLLSRLEKLGV